MLVWKTSHLLAALSAASLASSATVANHQSPFLHPLHSDLAHVEGSAQRFGLTPSGLHINSAPGHASRLLLHFHPDHYDDILAAKNDAQPILEWTRTQKRDWEEVTLGCGAKRGAVGGVESCREDDLRAKGTSELRQEDADGRQVDAGCTPTEVHPDGRAYFADCAPAHELLSAIGGDREGATGKDVSVGLWSAVARLRLPGRDSASYQWWVAHVQMPRANWPLVTPNTEAVSSVNRVAGLMQDPFIAKAGQARSNDEMKGVDLRWSGWNGDVTIRVPAPSAVANMSTPDDARESAAVGESIWAPLQAPWGGQVVWIGNYTRPFPPLNKLNNEHGICVSIRNEWGFVLRLCGEIQPQVSLGDLVAQGDHIGRVSRLPASREPRSKRRPADPPKRSDAPSSREKRYPYRFSKLRVAVARPDPRWQEWKSPDDPGWHFYDPLHALQESRPSSPIPPYSSLEKVFFARPTAASALNGSSPDVFGTSTDFFKPVLSGNVELIVAYEAFLPTPDDAEDGVDPLSLYKLEWASWRELDQGPWTGTCQLPDGVGWRPAFRPDTLGTGTVGSNLTLQQTKLLSPYVPLFKVGRFFPTVYSSQFDEKSRRLFYSPTRYRASDGTADPRASWDTTRERDGDIIIVFKASTYFGTVPSCQLHARVKIDNASRRIRK
ncbi:hypothetical protein IE81DRAFT_365561 [Ceraceosorus guamensis]|uniref:Peptidase M23 domain-containing protein n=1 Tax=Ceraceosorus guamensis TaxID=1522189 RepID=A0A316W4X5_9BASI|nr:hypothetical protein IE81DRAFT_365561 [Ceraceosorus guamensis]PWN43721.1 hypothetical protein IE81DRAFT_365561 [Ceraceosorus guamensis]